MSAYMGRVMPLFSLYNLIYDRSQEKRAYWRGGSRKGERNRINICCLCLMVHKSFLFVFAIAQKRWQITNGLACPSFNFQTLLCLPRLCCLKLDYVCNKQTNRHTDFQRHVTWNAGSLLHLLKKHYYKETWGKHFLSEQCLEWDYLGSEIQYRIQAGTEDYLGRATYIRPTLSTGVAFLEHFKVNLRFGAKHRHSL